ncbi:thiamine pyrophosphate-dependent dehydrogenase E1 component subunit alpha [bacterium]|nr:thiamine pyrophosphate-dependent dehydrogenase E1 component subunit alpha [bacterium]
MSEISMATLEKPASIPAQPFKDKNFSIYYFKQMLRIRALEERLIKMMRSGDGYFWIGGPGEEAFSVALGAQVHKGHGVDYDFLHLHYRSNGIALTMGSPMIDFVRQMKNTANDPFSGGRNFVAHICKKEWNIVPVTSPIETQFACAIGTGIAQRRAHQQNKTKGVTVVVGGDAGTAEGEFASCLIWASRPGFELPMLIITTNNGYGISTPGSTQHGEKHIADRAKAFGIEAAVVDGNQPEKVWAAVQTAFDHIRETSRPYFLEVKVSRLHGHSSSSGAARVTEEVCCIEQFEKKLVKNKWITESEIEDFKKQAYAEAQAAHEEVKNEAYPDASTAHDHTFAGGARGGVPGRDF